MQAALLTVYHDAQRSILARPLLEQTRFSLFILSHTGSITTRPSEASLQLSCQRSVGFSTFILQELAACVACWLLADTASMAAQLSAAMRPSNDQRSDAHTQSRMLCDSANPALESLPGHLQLHSMHESVAGTVDRILQLCAAPGITCFASIKAAVRTNPNAMHQMLFGKACGGCPAERRTVACMHAVGWSALHRNSCTAKYSGRGNAHGWPATRHRTREDSCGRYRKARGMLAGRTISNHAAPGT